MHFLPILLILLLGSSLEIRRTGFRKFSPWCCIKDGGLVNSDALPSPTVERYTKLIDYWSEQKRRDAAERVEEVMTLLLRNSKVPPDIQTCQKYLETVGKDDPERAERALERIQANFRSFEDAIGVDVELYNTLIRLWVNSSREDDALQSIVGSNGIYQRIKVKGLELNKNTYKLLIGLNYSRLNYRSVENTKRHYRT